MINSQDIFIIIIFCLTLLCVPIFIIFWENKDFSENENRYLAQQPVFSFTKLVSKEYMEEAEKYVNDQFPLRNFWISLKADVIQSVGCREVNGVYLADEQFLIEKWLFEDFDAVQLQKNIESINFLANRNPKIKTFLMLIPTAAMIYKDKLPKYAPIFDQQIAFNMVKQGLENIKYIDVVSMLFLHCHEDIYYKTDHHWTTQAAFLAYQLWCTANKQNFLPEDFHQQIVTQDFQGALQAKFLSSFCAQDSVSIYDRQNQLAYTVDYNFGKEHSDSIYSWQRLQEKDKYQVFLNGNHPELTIHVANYNEKNLLILKDSFANAFIPFLLNDYETIHILDLRYYMGNVDQYIKENQITDCLILYNIKNFCEDKNISEKM